MFIFLKNKFRENARIYKIMVRGLGGLKNNEAFPKPKIKNTSGSASFILQIKLNYILSKHIM